MAISYTEFAPEEWREAYGLFTPCFRTYLADLAPRDPDAPGFEFYAKAWEIAFQLLDLRAEPEIGDPAGDRGLRVSRAITELALHLFVRRAMLCGGSRHDVAWLKGLLKYYGSKLGETRNHLHAFGADADQLIYETAMSEARRLLCRARR